jgi:hypothetical protein
MRAELAIHIQDVHIYQILVAAYSIINPMDATTNHLLIVKLKIVSSNITREQEQKFTYCYIYIYK